jgi:hypothetical protein
VWINCDLTLYL